MGKNHASPGGKKEGRRLDGTQDTNLTGSTRERRKKSCLNPRAKHGLAHQRECVTCRNGITGGQTLSSSLTKQKAELACGKVSGSAEGRGKSTSSIQPAKSMRRLMRNGGCNQKKKGKIGKRIPAYDSEKAREFSTFRCWPDRKRDDIKKNIGENRVKEGRTE